MLHHHVRGSGTRPVLLLHGFLGSAKNLGALARAWSQADETLKLVLPDQLGHGRSPPLPPSGSLDAMAESVADLLDQLGLDHADIVGHSMGGRVALALARRSPSRVGKIALLDIRPGPIERSDTEQVLAALLAAPDQTESRAAMRQALEDEGLSRPVAEWLTMAGEPTSDDRFGWRIDRSALAHFHDRMRSEDLWPVVERTPTVCIRGETSAYVGIEDERRLEELGGRTVTIAGAGHFLHAERTDAVVKALLALLG